MLVGRCDFFSGLHSSPLLLFPPNPDATRDPLEGSGPEPISLAQTLHVTRLAYICLHCPLFNHPWPDRQSYGSPRRVVFGFQGPGKGYERVWTGKNLSFQTLDTGRSLKTAGFLRSGHLHMRYGPLLNGRVQGRVWLLQFPRRSQTTSPAELLPATAKETPPRRPR